MPNYTGLSFPPRIGPNGGWVKSTGSFADTAHIKEAITLEILTEIGERVMEVEFGSSTLDSLFENMDSTLLSVLKYKVQNTLSRWEPRIRVIDVSAYSDMATSASYVNVSFQLLDAQITDSVQVGISS